MTAKEIDAPQAQQMGLVTHVSDAPMEHALALAEELKNRNPDTIRQIKHFYQKAWHKNDSSLLAGETLSQIKIISGKNQRIAVARESKSPDKPWKL